MPRGAPLLGSGLRRFRYRCVDRPPWMTWHRVSVHYWTGGTVLAELLGMEQPRLLRRSRGMASTAGPGWWRGSGTGPSMARGVIRTGTDCRFGRGWFLGASVGYV